jgi:tRNA-dihydrouridine synthase
MYTNSILQNCVYIPNIKSILDTPVFINGALKGLSEATQHIKHWDNEESILLDQFLT